MTTFYIFALQTEAFLENYCRQTGEPLPRRVLENEEKVAGNETYCDLCDLELTSKIVALSHYQGKTHAKNKYRTQFVQPGHKPKEDPTGICLSKLLIS